MLGLLLKGPKMSKSSSSEWNVPKRQLHTSARSLVRNPPYSPYASSREKRSKNALSRWPLGYRTTKSDLTGLRRRGRDDDIKISPNI